MTARARRSTVEVTAPLGGTIVALEDVPDPVFSGSVVGRGLAILPTEPDTVGPDAGRVVVVAPCAGRLRGVYPHALMIQVDSNRAVLVHLGLDTAQLDGDGFEPAAREGDWVVGGQPLLAWSPAMVRAGGRSTLCPLVAIQATEAEVVQLLEPGDRVAEGQGMLLWS